MSIFPSNGLTPHAEDVILLLILHMGMEVNSIKYEVRLKQATRAARNGRRTKNFAATARRSATTREIGCRPALVV